jgi:GNAT superfamily N-acetyltransferase
MNYIEGVTSEAISVPKKPWRHLLEEEDVISNGGAGSGHRGHRGIPGERGGSLPGTGGGKDTFTVKNRQFVDQYFGDFRANAQLPKNLTVDEFTEDVWSFRDEKTGMYSDIEEVTASIEGPNRGLIKFSGAVRDEKGKRVGNWVRFLDPNKGSVENDLFGLDKELQGKGFGGRFYADVEQRLIDYHVTRVKMFANMEVGGYAWARMGFDWADESDARRHSGLVINRWILKYGDTSKLPLEGNRFAPWEIASLTGPDGFAIGKAYLIGKNWDGVKELDTSTRGFQVGEVYYHAKGYK